MTWQRVGGPCIRPVASQDVCVLSRCPAVTAIVGDIAPSDNVSKAEKHRREVEAMHRIGGILGNDSPIGGPAFCEVCSQSLLSAGCRDAWRLRRAAWLFDAGQELQDLWQEYEQGSTEEAQLLKDIDKVS